MRLVIWMLFFLCTAKLSAQDDGYSKDLPGNLYNEIAEVHNNIVNLTCECFESNIDLEALEACFNLSLSDQDRIECVVSNALASDFAPCFMKIGGKFENIVEQFTELHNDEIIIEISIDPIKSSNYRTLSNLQSVYDSLELNCPTYRQLSSFLNLPMRKFSRNDLPPKYYQRSDFPKIYDSVAEMQNRVANLSCQCFESYIYSDDLHQVVDTCWDENFRQLHTFYTELEEDKAFKKVVNGPKEFEYSMLMSDSPEAILDSLGRNCPAYRQLYVNAETESIVENCSVRVKDFFPSASSTEDFCGCIVEDVKQVMANDKHYWSTHDNWGRDPWEQIRTDILVNYSIIQVLKNIGDSCEGEEGTEEKERIAQLDSLFSDPLYLKEADRIVDSLSNSNDGNDRERLCDCFK